MNTEETDYRPEFDSFKGVLLDIAQERTVSGVLRTYVEAVNRRPHVAIACVWLMETEEEIEPQKRSNTEKRYLKLVAYSGKTKTTPDMWKHPYGTYDKVPLQEKLVGRVAALARTPDPEEGDWEIPDWAVAEGIIPHDSTFGNTPIIYKGEVLGVVAVYLNMKISEQTHQEGITWQRIFSDHLATAIANARAFEEIERLQERTRLENLYLREEFSEANLFGEIKGKSRALQRVLDQVELVAPNDTSVIILGESGTGKELIARAIHQNSKRTEKAFIRVNCASIPRELFESEFFGHVKGAFTGAVRDRIGRFELADGGTLFLDEVGEIPLELQAKLLRVLQEKSYERIGEERTRNADVRIIAATNRDIREDVTAGRFREDLYFRLSVFPIEVPPLRERQEDIAVLAQHFIQQKCQNMAYASSMLKPEHLSILRKYDWPGNVRELQNVIERAIITGRGKGLNFDFLTDTNRQHATNPECVDCQTLLEQIDMEEVIPEDEWRGLERRNLIFALRKTDWKIQGKGGASELLKIKPTTLRSRMQAFNIQKPV